MLEQVDSGADQELPKPGGTRELLNKDGTDLPYKDTVNLSNKDVVDLPNKDADVATLPDKDIDLQNDPMLNDPDHLTLTLPEGSPK